MMPTVLVSAPYIIPVLGRFKPVFEHHGIQLIVPEVQENMAEARLLEYAGKFDGALCGDDAYTAQVLDACVPRLRVISKWGTGVDSIDVEACARLGVKVYRTPNAFTTAVADSVMGYILAFARRQPWMDRELRAGKWSKLPGVALSECALGIIGMGNIGKAVARRARAFGMRVLGNDIVDIDHAFVSEFGIEMMGLDALLLQSDYISINCDLNPTSQHLINAKTLAGMKPQAVLINTARGAIVDQRALVDALRRKQIAGAALDVFEQEPLRSEDPLIEMQNVLLAPHNSNSSPAAWERVHRNTILNLMEGLDIHGVVLPDATRASDAP